MTDIRDRIVAEARSWIGTPYHHHGTVKGAGVDCAMLPQAVYTALGLMAPADFGEYPTQWHLHHDEERYLAIVTRYAAEIAEDQAEPGDFVLFRVGRTFAHGGVVVDPARRTMIHASMEARAVILERWDAGRLARSPRRFFVLNGVAP